MISPPLSPLSLSPLSPPYSERFHTTNQSALNVTVSAIVYMYVSLETERERERERVHLSIFILVSLYKTSYSDLQCCSPTSGVRQESINRRAVLLYNAVKLKVREAKQTNF